MQQQRADRLKNNSKQKLKSEKEISKIAHERIQLEEKEKKKREVAEEAAIKKEMAKIKLQLDEEKRKQIEKIEKCVLETLYFWFNVFGMSSAQMLVFQMVTNWCWSIFF